MQVTCLTCQEKLFETRILRRMAKPVFIPHEQLPEGLQTPLLLFGKWFEGDFWAGVRWLATLAYRLPYPCILCPPFEAGSLDQLLGLAVALEARAINANALLPQEKDLRASTGVESLQVQADFGFVGPAGRSLVVTAADRTPVVVALQPKSTVTPLLLCGVRLFSASSLSVEADRQALFEALVTWATAQRAASSAIEPNETQADDLDPALFNSLSVLLAGTSVRSSSEVINAAESVLGLTLTPAEVGLGLHALAQNDLIQQEGEAIVVHMEPLEQYIQQQGLWPYVRMLRRDLAR
ncbi:MAG: hypothetical protein BroJett011_07520 [Chloroflexota bacterium]|nr:MAG: hypothetical protein BroJett011_07520 [Chloroflexota bacterium]